MSNNAGACGGDKPPPPVLAQGALARVLPKLLASTQGRVKEMGLLLVGKGRQIHCLADGVLNFGDNFALLHQRANSSE